ncbi:hypothetical protein PAHAL_5G255600 [Panicum hallii]|uniref:Uncharacterized protein n=1 Tax=Panicum hallii TaxID=206008 RepID=A0A2T8IL74_9POAL|nr:hypothetical protein PAHAL_5G255600 [Panicum hallii]
MRAGAPIPTPTRRSSGPGRGAAGLSHPPRAPTLPCGLQPYTSFTTRCSCSTPTFLLLRGLADARRAFDGMPHGGVAGVAHAALSLFVRMITGMRGTQRVCACGGGQGLYGYAWPRVYKAGAW